MLNVYQGCHPEKKCIQAQVLNVLKCCGCVDLRMSASIDVCVQKKKSNCILTISLLKIKSVTVITENSF